MKLLFERMRELYYKEVSRFVLPARKLNYPKFFIITGISLIVVSLAIFILTFYPIFKLEINYEIYHTQAQKEVNPIDLEFGIVVPKIRANSAVVANVDLYQEKEYQWVLTKGVAHAKGSAFPGGDGNVFLFSHSAVNFFEANRYNAIFYLINKLEKGDLIEIYYKGRKYEYAVSEKKVVEPQAVQYLKGDHGKKTITLMTCTPPGTTFKRLLVIGELKN